MNTELRICKRILVNNGFANREIDKEISELRSNQNGLNNEPETNENVTTIYYENQMTSGYKADERILQSIVHNNIVSVTNNKIKLLIYYKNKKIKNLVMNNNPCKKTGVFQETNVVYKFSCNREGCRLLPNMDYIGLTTTTLSRRLTCHLQSGGPRNHLKEAHNETITRTVLEECTSVVMRCPNANRLAIAEALITKDGTPAINLQTTGFVRTVRLFSE